MNDHERGSYMTRGRAERVDARIDELEARVDGRLDELDGRIHKLAGLYVELAKRQVQAIFDATRSLAEWLGGEGGPQT